MRMHTLSAGEWAKALAVGAGAAILTGAIMFAGMKTGVSPLPKPLGLAFAKTLLGANLPLPVGMLFHAAWVMLFSIVYIVFFRNALTFMRAFWLAVALWVLTLVFFFPIVGWGFLGLAITPKLIIGSAVPHLLFALFLWGLSRMAFSTSARSDGKH